MVLPRFLVILKSEVVEERECLRMKTEEEEMRNRVNMMFRHKWEKVEESEGDAQGRRKG